MHACAELVWVMCFTGIALLETFFTGEFCSDQKSCESWLKAALDDGHSMSSGKVRFHSESEF